ncbi:MAG: acyl-ACP--UDP-N-acetylglucosamine O-acyltransferase [Rhodospirillales bacterium]|nr:acyl-ACP--UDP-N-acetylglucosamine O-acyltransferase [Rhodospirillales bacterium]MDE2198850.1 acyl-ACP--UDP-N-acetylglucosamine O-acyltransferase [Rhodospirillales bacterium]MDE2574832.1 acyl-ACP--UDP-N-acetylglucosamine O-acyltransferase [Rhodospirillales bacterium]
MIGEGARIGPWCQIGPDCIIEAGAHLISHVVVDGHTRIGEQAVLYPFCTVGMAPQDLKYRNEPTRTEIGARTQIREHATIHRGTVTGSGITRVGADCLLMAVVHVAHDCALGNGVVVANNVVMGGHVTIGDNAVIGGAAAIHQFVRIGRAAMIGGVSGVEADVIPFGSVIGNRARLAGLNIIGLRRRGFERAQIQALRAAFRMIFKGSGVFAQRVARARAQFGAEPLVGEILAFIDQPSRRGLIRSAVLSDDDDEG